MYPLVYLIALWLTIMPFSELIDNFTVLKIEFGTQLRVDENAENEMLDIGARWLCS